MQAHPRLRVGTFADAGEAGREPHPDNPNFIDLVMDSPLAGDDWFNNIRDPRIVKVMVDILGPNINFHNGKLRIKPPGYVNSQGWHQDWPTSGMKSRSWPRRSSTSTRRSPARARPGSCRAATSRASGTTTVSAAAASARTRFRRKWSRWNWPPRPGRWLSFT